MAAITSFSPYALFGAAIITTFSVTLSGTEKSQSSALTVWNARPFWKKSATRKPDGFDPIAYLIGIFSMYDGETKEVRLKCDNSLMKTVIDRFRTVCMHRPLRRRNLYRHSRDFCQPYLFSAGCSASAGENENRRAG